MRFFFREQVIQSRLGAVDAYNRDVVSTVTTVRFVTKPQVLSGEQAAMLGGAVGQTFQLFCADTVDIQEGDLLKDSQDRIYKVQTVSLVDEGVFTYQQLIVFMEKE